MIYFLNKNITILGIGITGLSSMRFFISLGIFPKVIDTKINHKNKHLIPNFIESCIGFINEEWVLNSDLLVVSPGFPSYSKIILKAKNIGIEIINDIEIFCRFNKSLIISITGTNGKTTVVSLLYNICKSAGINVSLGGNIGIPVLSLLNKKSDLYILELSSFQLEYIPSLKSFCSGITNINVDHMDRYPLGIQDYVFSKLNIFRKSKYCFINSLDVYSKPYNFFEKNIIKFGEYNSNYFIKFNKNQKYLNINGKDIINIKNLYLKEIFNCVNFLLVLAISDILNISRNVSLNIISKFKGLPHRFNILGNKNNILWINDSKSTNIYSTKEALRNLYYIKGKIWLLLGGDGKKADFINLLKPYLLKFNNLRICCFGKSKEILYSLVPDISRKFISMHNSVLYILKRIKFGDVILLSPACSSLDQFNNFEDRGNKFIYLFNKYA